MFRDDPNKAQSITDSIVKGYPTNAVKSISKLVTDETKKFSKTYNILYNCTHQGIFGFSWDKLEEELQKETPSILSIISAIVHNQKGGDSEISKRDRLHVLMTTALALRGRHREMSSVAYQIGFILKHGGCTRSDIERISKLGVCMSPMSLDRKLKSWQEHLDQKVTQLRNLWIDSRDGSSEDAPIQTFQLAGDNWDRNILPSYRTTKDKTLSLHLFQVVAFKDRIIFDKSGKASCQLVQTEAPTLRDEPDEVEQVQKEAHVSETGASENHPTEACASHSNENFIPSLQDQWKLKQELSFLVATAVINNIPCLKKNLFSIYPHHYPHKYTDFAGEKTQQFPLGLFDCDERKTKQVIQLMKVLSSAYVPQEGGDISEQVFFGGDRLTDERIQIAQQALANGDTPSERLEGFISKIEDFHRLMNFMEAICKLTYSTKSVGDIGTAYYFRNYLDKRDVKDKVKNCYRPYKMLYYVLFEGICCCLLLQMLGEEDWESDSILPDDFTNFSKEDKISWIEDLSSSIVTKYIFEGKLDMFDGVREVLLDPDHEENYWMPDEKDRFHCHFCEKIYVNLGSVKCHEKNVHMHDPKRKDTKADDPKDELYNNLMLLFKLVSLHKNLDTAVNMGDGGRVVRSAKYETPIYNRTGKYKYLIGSIQVTSLVEEHLSAEQVQRFIWNRFVNISGGKTRNLSIDEYIEMLNRDTKVACRGYQTKESIIAHSKEFPLLTDSVKHFDHVTSVKGRKGFHKLPSFEEDVKKVTIELMKNQCLVETNNRKMNCKAMSTGREVFMPGIKGLPTMIARHKSSLPVRRLRDRRF